MTFGSSPNQLVAVLHSLPPGDGTQTLRRVKMASRTLGCETFSVVNLYPSPLANVAALEAVEAGDIWQRGRDEIEIALERPSTTDVLLGYGVKTPSGPQRIHFRSQLEWLEEQLRRRGLRVWTYGDRPAHPSRWQRVAYRHSPGSTPEEVAGALLKLHINH